MVRLLRFRGVACGGLMLALMFVSSSCSDEQSGQTSEEARPAPEEETREVTKVVTVAEAPKPSRDAPTRQAPTPPTSESSSAEVPAAQEESPEDVLALQYRLINEGDYDGAYALFAQQSKQIVSPDQYRTYFESNSPYFITDYSFPSALAQGDTANVEAALTVNSASGTESYQRAQELRREDGAWRVVMRDEQASAFVASAAPSGAQESAQYDSESARKPASEPADEEIGEIFVRVTGDPGIKFQGSIGTLDGSRSVEGTTPEEFAVEVDTGAFAFDSVSANAQNSGGSGNLVVEVVRDGEIVAEQSTTAQYGVAQVTWSPNE